VQPFDTNGDGTINGQDVNSTIVTETFQGITAPSLQLQVLSEVAGTGTITLFGMTSISPDIVG
jgi:hypothetical protein